MLSSHTFVAALAFVALSATLASAQSGPSAPTVTYPTSAGVSPSLSSLPTARWAPSGGELKFVPPPRRTPPHGPGPGGSATADEALQRGSVAGGAIQPKASFGGIGGNGYLPPDANIAVGKTTAGVGYVVQMVNSDLAVFNKASGALVSGPVTLASLWTNLGGACAASNAGDPIVQYDAAADRWLISQLGSLSAPYSECIAVSLTNDPRGAYSLYAYSFGNNLNDYPKFGVWSTKSNSAYLASYNLFSGGSTFVGAELCAYDRAAMVSGLTQPAQICSVVTNDGNFLPADLDGPTPPTDGTPGYFLNFETGSSLRLYQASAINFTAGTWTLTAATPDIAVGSFSPACGGGTCIVQPNSQKLDSLGDRLMYRLAYRVFSDHAALVVNHSIAAGSSVGVRWYELRQPNGGAFAVSQQGTYIGADSAYRWMGSAAMDGSGDIAIGYSKSSSSVYPSIAFASRTPTMTPGSLGAENIMQVGKGAQTTYSRWGDYSALRIDPDDDATFWYTNEYYTSNNRFSNYIWSTAIGSFTVSASGVTNDFTLSAPALLTVTRGRSGNAAIKVNEVSGSNLVALSVTGLPARTSASYSPMSVTVNSSATSATSTLTISVTSRAAKGTYSLNINGKNNNGAVHTATMTLTIN